MAWASGADPAPPPSGASRSPPRATAAAAARRHVPTLVGDRSPRGWSRRTPRSGGPKPRPRRRSGLAGLRLDPLAPARRRARRAARRARRRGRRPRRARRDGRLVAGPRGHRRAPPASAPRSCSTPPTPARSAARSPTGWTAPWSSSPASPAARWRPTASGAPTSQAFIDAGIDAGRRGSSSSPTPARRSSTAPARRATGRCSPTPTSAAATARSPRSGWCPSALAGVDVGALLDEAGRGRRPARRDAADNPGARARRRAGRRRAAAGRDKVVLAATGSGIVGFGDWAEQLIAESTGKQGTRPAAGRRRGPRRARAAQPGRRPARAPGRRGRRRDRRGRRGRDDAGGDVAQRHGPGRSARSSCSGSTPPRSPAGCSASTRSTSPTSRAPSRPPAACSTGASRRRRAGLRRRRRRGARRRRAARRRHRPGRRGRTPCSTSARARLPRGHGLPRPAGRRRPVASVRPALARRTAPAGDVRLGAAVPALHRASTTRAGRRRRLPADHRRGRRGPGGPGPAVHLRQLTRPRPPATLQVLADARPAGPAPAPHRPRGRVLAPTAGGRCASEPSPGHRRPQPAARPPRQAAAAHRRAVRLVIFGVTGDLARKKLMPAVYDLANRGLLPPGFVAGRLRPPRLGGRGLRPGRARRRARARPHPVPRGGLAAAWRGHSLRPGHVRRRRRVRPARRTLDEPRRRRAARRQPRVLPVDPAGAFPTVSSSSTRTGLADPSGGGVAPGGRSRSRSATTCTARSELNDVVDDVFTAGRGLPHRPLPRQGDRPEPAGPAVRQQAVRADLERQLRRPRADHDGRGHRHRRPRRLLRRHRRGPRRASRTTCSSCSR